MKWIEMYGESSGPLTDELTDRIQENIYCDAADNIEEDIDITMYNIFSDILKKVRTGVKNDNKTD